MSHITGLFRNLKEEKGIFKQTMVKYREIAYRNILNCTNNVQIKI
jgi:hypothetical protein